MLSLQLIFHMVSGCGGKYIKSCGDFGKMLLFFLINKEGVNYMFYSIPLSL